MRELVVVFSLMLNCLQITGFSVLNLLVADISLGRAKDHMNRFLDCWGIRGRVAKVVHKKLIHHGSEITWASP